MKLNKSNTRNTSTKKSKDTKVSVEKQRTKVENGIHYRNEHIGCLDCNGKPDVEPLNLKDFKGEKCKCLKIIWWQKR